MLPVQITLAGQWDEYRPFSCTVGGLEASISTDEGFKPQYNSTTNTLTLYLEQVRPFQVSESGSIELSIKYHIINVDAEKTESTLICFHPLALCANGCGLVTPADAAPKPVVGTDAFGAFEHRVLTFDDVSGAVPQSADLDGSQPPSGVAVRQAIEAAAAALSARLDALEEDAS